MIDVSINQDNKIRFQKRLWHPSELLLAECFNFGIMPDTGIIMCDPMVTSKKAIYEFIKLSFRSFSEAPAEQARRDNFYERLDAIYAQRDNYALSVAEKNLPYFNTLFAHQKEGVCETFFRQHNFLAYEMGLGKTVVSASLSRVHQLSRTLILCPSAVKWNWYRDLVKFGFNELFFTILDSKKSRSMIALHERFVIVNYEMLTKFEKHILSGQINHFIIDESHNIKSHTSQRFRNTKKIVDAYPDARITFLSGTPIKNRVNDIYAYLKLIGHKLGQSHKAFLDQYTITTTSRGGDMVSGGRNLNDLHVKLSNFMIRKTKDECLDLPEKTFMSYRFEMDDYRDEYNKIIEELSQLKEISSLTGNLHSLNIITSKAKLPGIIEIIDNILENDRKIVVFGSYKEPLNILENHYGKRCVKVDGSIDAWTRDQRIQRFWQDEECVVFLGNMVAAGVGINLTNAADVLFLNFPLTPAELYQSIDRCHRIGQGDKVNVHYTFCDDSIDEYIYDIVVDKEKDIVAVVDQGQDVMLRENMTELLVKKLLGRDTNKITTEEATELSNDLPDFMNG